jgi:2-dehydro-3-deoxyphosphooctonate aldolase (KDO 8-P synthase)
MAAPITIEKGLMHKVKIHDITMGSGGLVLIAGPCVIESEDHALFMARNIRDITSRIGIPYIFKASFDKANRTSIDSYRGPGLIKGLKILEKIRKEVSIPVLSDIHDPSQAGPAAKVLDMLQIPAFLCRQTDLLVAAGITGLPVNIKKGQFMAPWDMANAASKVQSTGNNAIVLTERGVSLGYNNLVCDLRSLAIMRSLGFPVILDVTHSLQIPGGQGTSSGGKAEYIRQLARAGVAFGLDGVFLEVHDNPDKALSDGPNSLRLDMLEPLLMQLKKIHEVAL